MTVATKPRFRELTRDEILAVLARNHIGHLAFSYKDQVEVQPVHYVLDDEWIFGRTSPGDKLRSLRHNWWAAFGVDEIEGPFDWRSVMVRGGFYPLSPRGSAVEVARWNRAIAALRAVVPETLTEEDPVPFRTIVFGIALQELSGRVASSD